MAVQRNYVQLIGHLGADPEITRYDNGRAKAVFRLATNEYYRTTPCRIHRPKLPQR